ncbi:SdrD B-like domain-containing protein [Arthrobacter russicus]
MGTKPRPNHPYAAMYSREDGSFLFGMSEESDSFFLSYRDKRIKVGDPIPGSAGDKWVTRGKEYVENIAINTGTDIRGYVFNDMNGDGARTEDEPGVAGAVVLLKSSNGTEIVRATSDSDGRYSFDARVPIGTGYSLELLPVRGEVDRTKVSEAPAEIDSGIYSLDFGIRLAAVPDWPVGEAGNDGTTSGSNANPSGGYEELAATGANGAQVLAIGSGTAILFGLGIVLISRRRWV